MKIGSEGLAKGQNVSPDKVFLALRRSRHTTGTVLVRIMSQCFNIVGNCPAMSKAYLKGDHENGREVRVPKESVLDISPSDDGGVSDRWESYPNPWEINIEGMEDHEFLPKDIEGTPEFIQRIKEVCLKHIHVFKQQVSKSPAHVRPFRILVNKDKMEEKKNSNKSKKPRPQSKTRQDEIRTQIDKMTELELIKPSEALFLSHVHMALKPNGSWRFCVDYRELNDICQSVPWPLPNIDQTLQRLGSKKYKYFGVMDLTSGYWQAPLDEESKELTAFTSWMGNFQWDRVPFGLKGAPAYFQKEMQITVLRELMYTLCEDYMDDIIFGGESEDDYLRNLDKILTRVSEHNITINPKKCKLGKRSVEIVGHVIDEFGITFSDEKKESIMKFPLPQQTTQLRSFLGLANYFRNQIDHFTETTHLLYGMVNSHSTLTWGPDAIAQFEATKLKFITVASYFLSKKVERFICT